MKFTVTITRYIAVVFLASALTAAPLLAQEVSVKPDKTELSASLTQQALQELVNTADNVEAEQKYDEMHEAQIENETHQATNQTATVNADTGNNTAERNISIGGNAGVIQTGTVAVVSQAVAAGASTASDLNTGHTVNPSSDAATSSETSVQNTSKTDTDQSTTVNANTGNNRADRNIAIGGGTAGAVSTGSVGVYSNQHVALDGTSIQLASTGDRGGANSSLDNQFISQLTHINANTGNNTANRNIAFGGNAGVIHTGSIGVGVSYVVDDRENATVAAGAGSSDPTVGLRTEELVGATGKTSMSLSSRNETVITQSAQITANTGGNVANRNIAYNGTAGGISTGAIGVQVQFLADLSKNKTVVYPKTINNNYIYPTSAPIVNTEPTPEPKQWASSYHNVATPARRTRPVSYTAASGPLVMGTSTTRVPGKAASQNAPLMQTVQAGIFDTVLSHLLVVIITLLVVAGRKPVHI